MDGIENKPHVGQELGLYYLDALDEAAGQDIETHLHACEDCRRAAAEVCETIAALALLEQLGPGGFPASAVAPSIDEGMVASASAQLSSELQPTASDPSVVNASNGDRAGRRRGHLLLMSSHPRRRVVLPRQRQQSEGPGRTVRAPSQRRGRSRWLPAQTASLAALGVVVLVGVIAAVALVRGFGGGSPSPALQTVAATGSDRTSGVSVSLVVGEDRDGVLIRATLNGLRPGSGYALHATTGDGATLPVVSWIATSTAQDVSGHLPTPLAMLSFFTVTKTGNGAIVSVYLPRGGTATASPSGRPPR